MIYTLTLNPALDHIVRLQDLDLGETNRMDSENIKAGGKGINVSKILQNLGEDSLALAYVAGFSGKELERLVQNEGLKTDFIEVKEGFTRINVKIKASLETEINGPGLVISKEEEDKLFSKLDKIKTEDYLFLSGSIPSSLDGNFYEKIMQRLEKINPRIIVDVSGKTLLEILKYKPFLVKPNRRELEEIFNTDINNNEDLVKYSKKLQDMGAVNVIISLGACGAFFLSQDKEEIFLKAPQGKLVDTVGSGDSMVAGFVYAIKNDFSTEDAFKFSVSCGSASAFSKNLATKDEIYKIFNNL